MNLGDLFLICDDSSLQCQVMMNEWMVQDGMTENDLDHNGLLLVIKHMKNILVLLKENDGKENDDGI